MPSQRLSVLLPLFICPLNFLRPRNGCSEPPIWGRQNGVTPMCSDLFDFPRFLPICSDLRSLFSGIPRFVLICSDLLRFLPICSDLFFRTDQGNPFLPTPFAHPWGDQGRPPTSLPSSSSLLPRAMAVCRQRWSGQLSAVAAARASRLADSACMASIPWCDHSSIGGGQTCNT